MNADATTLTDIAGFSGERLARIDHMMQVDIARGRFPGAVLLIERHGKTVLKRAWGYRDRTTGSPMGCNSIFRIYSMTKPIVSLATMMLAAEGHLHLSQPISDFIPSFADTPVLRDGKLVAPRQAPTVHDLLRHTSGLTYQSNGGPVGDLYGQAGFWDSDLTNEAFANKIAGLPFAHEPGTVWEYGHSTDVLGRVVEVAAGRSLGAVLRKRILGPLGMNETAFSVASPIEYGRIAEAFPGDIIAGRGPLFDPRRERAFEAGGMGLVSTVDDYARFARLLLGGGTLDDTLLLSKRMLQFMTADHIGASTGIVKQPGYMAGAGYGFGLGFAVRLESGAYAAPGSVGEFGWSGVAGTYFWIDPEEEMFVILLAQAPRERTRLRMTIRSLVYDALVGERGLKAERRSRRNMDRPSF